MTCREKYMEMFPDNSDPVDFGHCPDAMGIYTEPDNCGVRKYMNRHKVLISCRECWDREIPENKEENSMIYAHIEPGFNPNYDRHWVENSYTPASADIHENCKVAEDIQAGLEIPTPEYVEAFKEMGEAAVKAAEAMGVTIPKILDSGNRREFGTGAVRDIQEGKGRCDLLPLDVVGKYFDDEILQNIAAFQKTCSVDFLYDALWKIAPHWGGIENRGDASATMFLEVSKHYEEGCIKYGERNWQKGIPVRCYIDSGVRHYLKFLRGDKDEPHDRAFVWNMLGAIWTCVHKPELCEYPIKLEVEG